MIVRNEARTLGRCLRSVRGIFDEILVTDTGSRDDTTRVAKSFGAVVSSFGWTDNFSEARNVSFSTARFPWIFVLDGDEWVDRPFIDGIGRLRERLSSDGCVDVGGFQVLMKQEDGSLWGTAVRLFRNNPRISYVYKVHEMVDPTILGAGFRVEESDVSINTTRGGNDRTGKALRYLMMTLPDPDLDRYPRPGDSWVLTGLQCVEFGRWDLAGRFFQMAVDSESTSPGRRRMAREWLSCPHRLPWENLEVEFRRRGGDEDAASVGHVYDSPAYYHCGSAPQGPGQKGEGGQRLPLPLRGNGPRRSNLRCTFPEHHARDEAPSHPEGGGGREEAQDDPGGRGEEVETEDRVRVSGRVR